MVIKVVGQIKVPSYSQPAPDRRCLNTTHAVAVRKYLQNCSAGAVVYGPPVHTSFPNMLWKFQTQVSQSQVTRSPHLRRSFMLIIATPTEQLPVHFQRLTWVTAQGVKASRKKIVLSRKVAMTEKTIDISFESKLLNFLIVCRFLLFVTNYDLG